MPKDTNKAVLTENVFVYGSLRRDQHNHHWMERLNHVFLSTGQIRGRVFDTVYGFPCLMEGSDLVDGEIYAVDEASLESLDWLEGHPDFYTRREVTTESGLNVWVYYGNQVQAGILREQ